MNLQIHVRWHDIFIRLHHTRLHHILAGCIRFPECFRSDPSASVYFMSLQHIHEFFDKFILYGITFCIRLWRLHHARPHHILAGCITFLECIRSDSSASAHLMRLQHILIKECRRPIGCHIFMRHFPQEKPYTPWLFCEHSLQLKASCASSPPYRRYNISVKL